MDGRRLQQIAKDDGLYQSTSSNGKHPVSKISLDEDALYFNHAPPDAIRHPRIDSPPVGCDRKRQPGTTHSSIKTTFLALIFRHIHSSNFV
ncbi:MAG: hypothetical protein OEY28_00655 [Nitrospira sp.]|nr:hypothetical protein [Nitrospira sp.]